MRWTSDRGIIANPNCAAIIAVMPPWPLIQPQPHPPPDGATYQAASGAGAAAMAELDGLDRRLSGRRGFEPKALPHPYAFNLFSHNTDDRSRRPATTARRPRLSPSAQDLRRPGLRIASTCVRVPVLRAHSVALTVECERPITPAEVRGLLAEAPGVRLVDDAAANHFPMPIEASGQRRDPGRPHPPGRQRPDGPLDRALRGRRPAAQGRGVQRRADRRGDDRLGRSAALAAVTCSQSVGRPS